MVTTGRASTGFASNPSLCSTNLSVCLMSPSGAYLCGISLTSDSVVYQPAASTLTKGLSNEHLSGSYVPTYTACKTSPPPTTTGDCPAYDHRRLGKEYCSNCASPRGNLEPSGNPSLTNPLVTRVVCGQVWAAAQSRQRGLQITSQSSPEQDVI
ncbi:hypothetical protein PGT21_032231 [Puccinia graminis f. sp. tritici]|uniref:Uncharacterized protein n=1 Tax=Puccinia graminis f. sp. tritici TaxID=56615 RepID=A0A5B0NE97_PUCGR|nr:hypothetical protein PGT21_032231 [Puccinia graminis f. sp. tritici]KAA1086340.1 hypothetical protein PGTUg99_014536 [Puccinia graminis f. sp. tritici]